MYWIYLILFLFMIVTPEAVQHGALFFGEEDLESILIFCFGMIGLLLYLGKESAFLRAIRDKLSLQKETNQIRRDLSQSYSYIGETNRRVDIVKNMVEELPMAYALHSKNTVQHSYQPILEAALFLTQSSATALYFVDLKNRTLAESYIESEAGSVRQELQDLNTYDFSKEKKFLWENERFLFIRSTGEVGGISAFLVVHRVKNQLEANGLFQVLVAEALFVYATLHPQ